MDHSLIPYQAPVSIWVCLKTMYTPKMAMQQEPWSTGLYPMFDKPIYRWTSPKWGDLLHNLSTLLSREWEHPQSSRDVQNKIPSSWTVVGIPHQAGKRQLWDSSWYDRRRSFLKWGKIPIAGWFIIDNPTKVRTGRTPIFGNHVSPMQLRDTAGILPMNLLRLQVRCKSRGRLRGAQGTWIETERRPWSSAKNRFPEDVPFNQSIEEIVSGYLYRMAFGDWCWYYWINCVYHWLWGYWY